MDDDDPSQHFEFSMMHPEGAPGAMQQMLGDEAFKQWVVSQMSAREQANKVADGHAALDKARATRITAASNVIFTVAGLLALSIPALLWAVYSAAFGF